VGSGEVGPWWVDRRPSRWSAVRRTKRSRREKGEITVEEGERERENATSCLGLSSLTPGGPVHGERNRERKRERGGEDQSDVREDRRESERDGRKEAKRDTETKKERRRQHSSFYHVGRTGGQLGGDLSFISG